MKFGSDEGKDESFSDGRSNVSEVRQSRSCDVADVAFEGEVTIEDDSEVAGVRGEGQSGFHIGVGPPCGTVAALGAQTGCPCTGREALVLLTVKLGVLWSVKAEQ